MLAAPGMLLVAAATAAALLGAPLLAEMTGAAVSPLVVALGIGAVLGSLRAVPRAAAVGLAWTGTHVLRTGVVLLGLQLSLSELGGLGWRGAAVVLTTVVCTFLLTLRAGQALGVDPSTRLYVATGFSICGAAAIAAMSGTVAGRSGSRSHDRDDARARGREQGLERGGRTEGGDDRTAGAVAEGDAVGTALALVTLYGTLAVLVLPWLASVIGLTDAQAGLLIGSSVQEVGQVVAAAGVVSAPALAAATVAKLARVVLLAPLTALVATRVRQTATTGRRRSAAPLVPVFVLGFLGAVLVRSTGVLPESVLAVADVVQRALLTAAMVALGTGVDLRRLVRSGGRSLALGAVATVVAVGVALTGTVLVG